MASAFYWYPDHAGPLRTTTLSMGLTDLRVELEVQGAQSSGFRGGLVQHDWGYRIGIVYERFGSAGFTSTDYTALFSMMQHLRAGGAVGFSRDHSKAWAALATQPPTLGATRIGHGGSALTGWSASAALTSGDQVVLDEPHPGYRAEHATVSSSGAGLLTVSSGLAFSYQRRPIVRWHDCWPALTLDPDGESFLGSDSARRTWDLRLALVYSPARALRIWAAGSSGLTLSPGALTGGGSGGLRGTTTSGMTLDELMGGGPSRPSVTSASTPGRRGLGRFA